MSDYCIVCAEHLEFTAYGPCGHKDTCSKCVLRLRTVLKDNRCVYCQQPCSRVFVTRFAGDYTKTLSKAAFDTLDEGVRQGDYVLLKSANAYFDDASHHDELKGLCSFSHPLVDNGRRFPSLKALKQELKNTRNAQFCNICLEGRKVFLSEQLVYTKSQLNKHLKQGDDEGPMSTFSGFKGHPECVYCSKRFYGENEQYEHMHRFHEECFLCKRASPHNHIYYANYAALEDHFRQDHHICTNSSCLEKKFVVFASEQELKTHMAREHGQEMTKAERKQAFSVPVGFNYDRSSRNSSTSSLPAMATRRPAVIIGGDANMPSRSRGSSRSNLALEDQVAAIEISRAHDGPVQQTSFSETDFPSMAANSSAAPAVGGRWAGSTGHQQSAPKIEDFPALPGTSKSAKRRAAKKKNLASVVGSQQAPRVIHSNGEAFPALGPKPNGTENHQKGIEMKQSRVSESLRKANAALAHKIQKRLGNGTKYEEFRNSSASWADGGLKTSQYHKLAVSLGLANLIPDIAATCRSAEKREELLQVHSVSFANDASPASAGNWVPPEVAALNITQAIGPWQCSVCSLVNSQSASLCEACGSLKPSAGTHTAGTSIKMDEFPSLGGPSSSKNNSQNPSSSSVTGSSKKAKSKKGKQSLSDFYKNTKIEKNAWQSPQLKGQWASQGAGQLAQRERALNDAYRK